MVMRPSNIPREPSENRVSSSLKFLKAHHHLKVEMPYPNSLHIKKKRGKATWDIKQSENAAVFAVTQSFRNITKFYASRKGLIQLVKFYKNNPLYKPVGSFVGEKYFYEEVHDPLQDPKLVDEAEFDRWYKIWTHMIRHNKSWSQLSKRITFAGDSANYVVQKGKKMKLS